VIITSETQMVANYRAQRQILSFLSEINLKTRALAILTPIISHAPGSWHQ